METRFVIGLLLFLFTLSCGYKAPPLPPEKLTPGEIKLLRVSRRPDLTVLILDVPKKYLEGKPIKAVKLEVERCNEKCKECEIIFKGWVETGKVVIEDQSSNSTVCYRIRGVTKRKKKFALVELNVLPEAVSEIPKLEVVHITEKMVELMVSGCDSYLVAVYRKNTPAGYVYEPYRQVACKQKAVIRDNKVQENIQYCYIVRNEKVMGMISYESAPSNEVCVRPMDVTPPPIPQNLSGVFYKGKVYLAWDPVKAPDLKGYIIYRYSNGIWERLNSKPWVLPTFVDKDPPLMGSLKYAVTSVDKNGNESKKSKSVTIR